MITPGRDPIGWRQLADLLRSQIRAGDIRPGARLPSEGYLAQTYGCATKTARAALQQMRTEGLAELVRGYGVVVRQQEPLELITPEIGATVTARTPSPAERVTYDVPEGWPILVVATVDGLEYVYPAHRYRIATTVVAPE